MTTGPPSTDTSSNKRALIFGLLAGPVVWSVYFLAVYAVGEFGCLSGALAGTVAGLPLVSVMVMAATLAALLVLAWAGWRTYAGWRRARAWRATGEPANQPGRTQFLEAGALILLALFSAAVLLTGVPMLVLRPCGWY